MAKSAKATSKPTDFKPEEFEEVPEKVNIAVEMAKLNKRGIKEKWKFEALRIHISKGMTLEDAFDEVNGPLPTLPDPLPPKPTPVKRKKHGVLTSTAVLKGENGSIEVGEKKPKSPAFKSKGEMDEFGFGSNTQASFVLAHIQEGCFTKKQIADKFIEHQTNLEQGEGGERHTTMKLSSLSVIYSDLVKPFGTYHASRSLIILKDASDVLSLEPKRAELVKKAIADGIVISLRGHNAKKHPDKVSAVLKKYGLPSA